MAIVFPAEVNGRGPYCFPHRLLLGRLPAQRGAGVERASLEGVAVSVLGNLQASLG